MARITFGAIITSIRGSIGGITFQTNKSGAIARLRPGNPKQPTSKQSNRIVEFSQLAFEWGQLDLLEQTDWNDFAAINPKIDRFGEQKILTGYNFFQALNSWRLKTGGSILVTPLPIPAESPVVDYFIRVDQIGIDIFFLDTKVDPDLELIIYATGINTTLSRSNFSRAKLLGIVATSIVTPFDITALWSAAIGMDYFTQTTGVPFKISFMLQVVNKTNGNTSVGNFKTFQFQFR